MTTNTNTATVSPSDSEELGYIRRMGGIFLDVASDATRDAVRRLEASGHVRILWVRGREAARARFEPEPARIEIWIDADRVVDGWGSALGARRVCVSRLSAPEREALERGALGLENAPPAGGRGRGSSYRRIVKVGPCYYARKFSPEQEIAEMIAD